MLVWVGVRVKRWGKSPPRETQVPRHGKPHRVQGQIGNRGTARSASVKTDRFRVSAAQTNDSLLGAIRADRNRLTALPEPISSGAATVMKKVSVLCFIIALTLQGCGKQNTQPAQMLRTDAGPISRRFPELGELRSVLWKSELLSKDSFLSTPAIEQTYRLRGFAYLSKERLAELVSQFEWQTMSNGWKPSLTVTNEDLELVQWWQQRCFHKRDKASQVSWRFVFEYQPSSPLFRFRG
jgi:hypothetical protein